MMRWQKVVRMELLIVLIIALVAADAADNRADYVGGTLSGVKSGQSGSLLTDSADSLVFTSRQQRVDIPYTRVRSLEYGQKVDRRYIEALLISPIFILSKKRDHYLTIHYKDVDGIDQALVLRIPKGSVRAMLASLEARTGLRVSVQDDEARKAYRS